jgi:hypothetical protein
MGVGNSCAGPDCHHYAQDEYQRIRYRRLREIAAGKISETSNPPVSFMQSRLQRSVS